MTKLGALLERDDRARSTIESTAPVSEAALRMRQPHLRALIVTEGQCAVGILTRRDIFERVISPQRSPHQTVVAEVMTPGLITAPLELAIEEAIALMIGHGIHHLPVVDRDGQLTGLLCYEDLASWLAEDREARISDLVFYITHG